VCEIRRALTRCHVADRMKPKTWEDRKELRRQSVDGLIHSVGFRQLHQSPLQHSYREKVWRLWHRRLFAPLDDARKAGGVLCAMCGGRGWEEHLHSCSQLRPLWQATEAAFANFAASEVPPGPDALLLGLHLPASREGRDRWWL
jgi:hypothetical protein